MTDEELNARFAAVADLLSDFAGEHDIALKRLEEGIDELRNEQRQTNHNLEELRSIVRTAVRAGVRERRERHQAEKELRTQLLETEQRNEQRLARMETAIERLADLMARRNGKKKS